MQSSSSSAKWMIFLIVFLGGLIGTLFWHLSRVEATAVTSSIIVMLTALNGLLMLTLIFVIARSLIKLYMGRRNKESGIRIRTKLVLAVLPLSLIPAAMMYFFSTQILSRTLQKLSIDANVSTVIDEAFELNQLYTKSLANHLKPLASLINKTLASDDLTRTQALLDDFGVAGCEIYQDQNLVKQVFQPSLSEEKIQRIIRTQRWDPQIHNELFDDGWLVWRLPYSSPTDNLVLLVTMDTPFSERWAFLEDSYRHLNHAKRKSEKVSSTFKTTLLIITFAVVFGGIWLGSLFSKSLMRSLNILIQGTDEVAKGNFENTIALQTGDELEDLGRAFNSMISQLKENRQELQSRAKALESVNLELKEQSNYTESMIREIDAGIISFRADGSVRTCNPAAQALLAFLPNHIDDFRPKSTFKQLMVAWDRYHRYHCQPLTQQIEWQFEHSTRNVALSLTPIRRNDKIDGTIMVLEDLTNLFNAQKLAAWGEVARRVAHEIKNPLTPLQLSIQRIYRKSQKGAEDLPEVITSGYETITQEIRLLEKLVNEFSQFAKLPAPVKESVDLVGILKNNMETYREICKPCKLQFQTVYSTLLILGDPSQVRQILSNLIRNAAAASKAGDTITIQLSPIQSGTNSMVHLKIIDEGHGIPEEDKPKVFIPYFSKAPKGTGLGLAIVHRIITDHGWNISIEDNQPKGTVFCVQIPLLQIEEKV